MERLKVLERTQDGFVVAECDLRLRGTGDLSSDSMIQSGSDRSSIFGRPIKIEILDEMFEKFGNTL